MEFGVLGENLHGIASHGTRIQEGLGSRSGGDAVRQGHASLSISMRSRRVWTTVEN